MLAMTYFDCATVVKVQYFEVKVVIYMCTVWYILKVLDCIKYQVFSFDALKLILAQTEIYKKCSSTIRCQNQAQVCPRVIAQHHC